MGPGPPWMEPDSLAGMDNPKPLSDSYLCGTAGVQVHDPCSLTIFTAALDLFMYESGCRLSHALLSQSYAAITTSTRLQFDNRSTVYHASQIIRSP